MISCIAYTSLPLHNTTFTRVRVGGDSLSTGWGEGFVCLFVFLRKVEGFSLRIYGKFNYNKDVSILVEKFTRGKKTFLSHLYFMLSVLRKRKGRCLRSCGKSQERTI